MSTTTLTIPPADDANDDELVGEAVHTIMRRRRFSQHRLAKAVGIHPTTLGKKLTGERPWRIGELRKIANVLEVDVATFLIVLPRLDSNQQPSD